MKKVVKSAFIVIILIALAVLLYSIYDTNRVILNEVTLSIDGLPKELEGFKILHITDLHGKRFGEKQQTLLNLIKDKKYDIAALTGDYFNYNNPDTAPIKEVMAGLKPTFGIYGTDGNNEPPWYKSKQFAAYRASMYASGYISVMEKPQVIKYNGRSILIAGTSTPPGKDIDFVIRLYHKPNDFMKAVQSKMNEPLPNLYLSGHTHGGQVRLPIIGALYVNNQGLFPKYVKGFYTEGGKNLFISSGLGTTEKFPLRVNCTPELVLITLKGK